MENKRDSADDFFASKRMMGIKVALKTQEVFLKKEEDLKTKKMKKI